MNKKLICRVLLCLMIIAMLPVQVHAIDRIDLSRSVNLTVNFTHEGQPLQGAEIQLYRVGDISERGELTITGVFASYPLQLNELGGTDWSSVALTMSAYAQQDQLQPVDTGITDEYGKAYFPRMRKPMEPGLYLITGSTLTYNEMCYAPVPTLIALPNRAPDSHHWDYDVTMDLKYTFWSAPIDCTVTKVWDDTGFKEFRPASVKVNLLCDGEVTDTVELSSSNNWSYTWQGLESEHTWTVTEEIPELYKAIISQDDDSFIIENEFDIEMYEELTNGGEDGIEEGLDGTGDKGEKNDEKLPQTGSPWWPVFAMLIAGMGCIIAGILRMRVPEDEA